MPLSRITATLLLLLPLVTVHTQPVENYRVVRIVGTVENAALKRTLRTGDIIPPRVQLKFRTDKDYLIVFSPKEGRKRIAGVPDGQPRELSLLIQSFVKADEKTPATRGSSYVDVLKSNLQGTVLILGNGIIELDEKQISLKSPWSIKAHYTTKDNRKVTLTVSSGQSLHLDKKTLFPPSQFPASLIVLTYSNPLESDDQRLGNFSPVYFDDATLLPEIKSITDSMKGSASNDVEKEVTNYLTQEYAKPVSLQLHAWLKFNHLLP